MVSVVDGLLWILDGGTKTTLRNFLYFLIGAELLVHLARLEDYKSCLDQSMLGVQSVDICGLLENLKITIAFYFDAMIEIQAEDVFIDEKYKMALLLSDKIQIYLGIHIEKLDGRNIRYSLCKVVR